jgi:hypothetical protein
MSADNVHAAKRQTPAPEPEEQPSCNIQTPKQLQPEVLPLKQPIIIWRSLMLEQ